MNKRYIPTLLTLCTLFLLLASCQKGSEDLIEAEHHGDEEHHEDEEGMVELTQAQYDQAHIQVGSMEKRALGSELRVNGNIDVPPQHNISINMPYGGFVKHTEMLPGTPVRKGQLLVVIENPVFIQFQQEYLESLANREYLKAEYERQEKLYQEKVASGKSYQQARGQFMANEARIRTMEARLKLIGISTDRVRQGEVFSATNLYSPVHGSVREVYANVGKYVGPEDVIMDITNTEDLHVELSVYENDIPQIRIGQRIRFSLANNPNHWREAEVFLVGSGVREDRSVTVHGHLKEQSNELLPGMYVAGRIEVGSQETWVVPDISLVRFGGKQYLFTYEGQRMEDGIVMHDFAMIEAKPGISEDGYTQVILQNDTPYEALKLVTEGAYTLLAKAKNSGGGHHHH